MKQTQRGYFSRQTALLLVLFGLVLVFALPQLGDFSNRNKLNEAYHLASESKLRVSEFYTLSARFPSTEYEMKSVTTSIFNTPDFVRAVVVENDAEEFDVVVKVYIDREIIGGGEAAEPYLYMAANRSSHVGLGLEWHCGADGIDDELLPRACVTS